MAKNILIVDDEPHIIELQKAILEIEGFKIASAESGEEALAAIKKKKPDLIMLDMMMPKMSGREVCEKIRADPKTKDIKVIFVTVAKFSEIGKEKLRELNVSDYITKPFDNDDYVARVKKALG